MTVAGTARATSDCVAVAAGERPDVVLVDASITDSAQTIRALARLSQNPKVVALAVPESEDAVMACIEAGAHAFVTVDQSIDELVATLRALADGQVHASPQLVAALLRRVSDLASVRDGGSVQNLTSRELQIAGLLRDGLSNKEIAARLQIEPATVKNHVHQVLTKLGVARRAQVGPRLREIGLDRRSPVSV